MSREPPEGVAMELHPLAVPMSWRIGREPCCHNPVALLPIMATCLARYSRPVLFALVLALSCLAPAGAATDASGAGGGLGAEGGLTELWRAVNGLGQTVQILQGARRA